MLGPLKTFAQTSCNRDVCASPSMDMWAVAVLAFELLRSPGGKEGVALFANKQEVYLDFENQFAKFHLCFALSVRFFL